MSMSTPSATRRHAGARGRRTARAALLMLCATLAAGCGSETLTAIRATWDDAAPIVDLEIAALPFDPDQILDSLVALAETPAPEFPELERAMRSYRRPGDDRLAAVNAPWLALRDSVARLADSLNAMDRRAPGYADRYARFRDWYARLARRTAERETAIQALSGNELDLAQRVTAAAESLRAWEYATFTAYDEAAAAAVAQAGRQVIEGATDEQGELRLALGRGRWWLVARLPDPENPFLEYYWNVPVTVTGWLPASLPLTPRNSVHRWRH